MQVTRRAAISKAEFIDKHLVANTPLITTEVIGNWDLFWSPDEWSRRFGQELAQVYDDLFKLIDVMPLSSFVRKFMGNREAPKQSGPQPYLRWYTKMKDVDFVWADEVFAKISDRWSLPSFLPDRNYLFPNAYDRSVDPAKDPFPAKGIFISGAGARTRLHQDPWGSDAVLCQLFGRKRVLLFSPAQDNTLMQNGVVVDIDNLEKSLASPASNIKPAYEDVLEAGEVLFIPSGWHHHVATITDSVSLTWNFVHLSTWNKFFRHLTSPAGVESELPVLRYFADLK
jgi:hypothetical protein